MAKLIPNENCHWLFVSQQTEFTQSITRPRGGGGGGGAGTEGVLPYMGYIGICRREGYGFQAVYSSVGYINPSIWV